MTEIYVQTLAIVIAFIAFGLFGKKTYDMINAYMQNLVGKTDWEKMRNLAKDVVGYVEQSPDFKDLVGPDKFDKAFLMIRELAKKAGFTYTDKQIQVLIEACVHEINSSTKPSDYGELFSEILKKLSEAK